MLFAQESLHLRYKHFLLFWRKSGKQIQELGLTSFFFKVSCFFLLVSIAKKIVGGYAEVVGYL